MVPHCRVKGGSLNETTNRQSRVSFAYTDRSLRDANPIIERAPDLRATFEAKRRKDIEAFKAMRRGSSMVQRQAPIPELKPSPEFAHGQKAQTFNDDWEAESRAAHRSNRLAEGRAIMGELEQHKAYLGHEDRNRQSLKIQAQGGDVEGATKEAFKLLRRIHEDSARILSKSQTFRQSIGNL